jgi:phospholipase C
VDQDSPLSRRSLLKGIAALGAAAAIGELAAGCSSSSSSAKPPGSTGAATTTTNAIPTVVRKPGSRPNPNLPEGVDTIPQIEHIVILMMENHSFDDHFGMLGRGDGFALDSSGQPIDANPQSAAKLVRAFHMPSTCQLNARPGQNWVASHQSWNKGKMDGFVRASGPVAMGYWTDEDIPFYYGLAKTFPLCDRWFCSTLAQTYPNRRFLLAGTASGIVATDITKLSVSPPPNGVIMDRFEQHDISWKNYYTDLPGTAVIPKGVTGRTKNLADISHFYSDAAAGKLPAVSFVDPNFGTQSEENPQDIRAGEAVAAKVINAAMHGPQWAKTVVIYTYDEHGGYYDHVPPPPAIKPDNIAPGVDREGITGAYDRYGIRVPGVIISPFAKPNYVSHVVHDQTSILKFIETKWNLGAMTYRDANADDLLDSLDFHAPPAFLEPPTLPAAGAEGTCKPGDPGGPIPPATAVVPASEASSLRVGATA